ncbi:MAG: DUF721 domain-containing protein [Planctomycetota bacterium]
MRQTTMFNDRATEVAELTRLHKAKADAGRAEETDKLGAEVVALFNRQIRPRHNKFGKLSAAWEALLPPELAEHCALESLTRGTLTVLVDSSPHLYELRQLMLAGVEQELKTAVPSAKLRKITLKPGRWYGGNGEARF